MAASKGTAVVDFGAFPGVDEGSIAVIGQAGILATSHVEAWIRCEATADHDEDDHLLAEFDVRVPQSLVIAGTGFTIKCLKNKELFGEEAVQQARMVVPLGRRMLWGRYNLNWVWS